MMRRIGIVLAALLIFVGCGKETAAILQYDLTDSVTTLDPQFAEGVEKTVAANLFLGLVRLTEDGSVQPAAAKEWKTTEGGCCYTFTLQENLAWQDGTPLTADDFLFTFERIFSAASPSPYAPSYSAIKNSASVLAGEASLETLGVSAPDAHTLVIRLSYPEESFLQSLAKPAAFPCNRAFFTEQRGRYGLAAENILTNGPFMLSSWTASEIKLLRSENAADECKIDGVNFTLSVSDTETRYRSGETDACLFASAVGKDDLEGQRLVDKSWSLLLNPNAEGLEKIEARRALLAALSDSTRTERFSSLAEQSMGLIAPAFSVNGISYRENVGAAEYSASLQNPREVFYASLGESEISDPSFTLLVCEGELGATLGGAMQKDWADALSLYVNLETVSYETLLSRVKSGSFDLALAPLAAEEGDTTGGMASFVSILGEEDLSARMSEILSLADPDAIIRALAEAENAVLASSYALPLCDTASLFAVRAGIDGLWYDAAAGIVHFESTAIKTD